MATWLDTIANVRIHATTGQQPRQHYDTEERNVMQAYLTPPCVHPAGQQHLTRKADKTGLISWQANKYSVPLAYQRTQVGVCTEDGQLLIFESLTAREIARHTLHGGKGNIIKNNNHYRDLSQTIAQHEEDIREQLGRDLGQRLCQCLQTAFPDSYKDQLAGFKSILKQHQPLNMELLERLSQRPSVSARQAKEFLEAYQNHPDRLLQTDSDSVPSPALAQQLTAYSNLPGNEQEVGHEYH